MEKNLEKNNNQLICLIQKVQVKAIQYNENSDQRSLYVYQ
jgi:hypothetical protein